MSSSAPSSRARQAEAQPTLTPAMLTPLWTSVEAFSLPSMPSLPQPPPRDQRAYDVFAHVAPADAAMAGSLSAVLARIAVQPLEPKKVGMQMLLDSRRRPTSKEMTRQLLRQYGVLMSLRFALLRTFAFSNLQFGSYVYMRRWTSARMTEAEASESKTAAVTAAATTEQHVEVVATPLTTVSGTPTTTITISATTAGGDMQQSAPAAPRFITTITPASQSSPSVSSSTTSGASGSSPSTAAAPSSTLSTTTNATTTSVPTTNNLASITTTTTTDPDADSVTQAPPDTRTYFGWLAHPRVLAILGDDFFSSPTGPNSRIRDHYLRFVCGPMADVNERARPSLLLCGLLGGLSHLFALPFTHFLDIAKTRSNYHRAMSAAATLSPAKYTAVFTPSSVFATLLAVVNADGRQSWRRGLATSAMGGFFYSSLLFGVYEFRARQMTTHKDRAAVAYAHFKAGSIAGFVAAALTYPFDTARKIMMTQQANAAPEAFPAPQMRPKNVMDAWHKLLAQDGPTALYRGVVPSLLKSVPQAGLTFALFASFFHP